MKPNGDATDATQDPYETIERQADIIARQKALLIELRGVLAENDLVSDHLWSIAGLAADLLSPADPQGGSTPREKAAQLVAEIGALRSRVETLQGMRTAPDDRDRLPGKPGERLRAALKLDPH